MNTRLILLLGVCAMTFLVSNTVMAQDTRRPFVRLADLDIEPAHLEAFKAAAREHATATLDKEPGVLALHAAAEKGNPARIRVFEMYTDESAYKAHVQSPHFVKFREVTASMISTRSLLDAEPVLLGEKPQLPANAHVRFAELEIANAQLEAYKIAVKEEINSSIRVEPGVLAIYSVALKENLNHLRFFEIYADEGAYRQHIESPHFKKYVDATKSMITSRRLYEMEVVSLGGRSR